MRHARARRHLSEYLDGTLAGRAAGQVEAHLLHCGPCRDELGELQRTRALLRELRAIDAAPDLSARVLARIGSGEGDASGLERLRVGLARLLSGPWMAPLATAAAGIALLTFVPRIEIEVQIPGGARTQPAAAVTRAPEVRVPVASRRVTQSVLPPSREIRQRLPAASFDCWEQPSFEACQEQRHALVDLALRDTRAFLARLDAVPSPARERWIGELSRFAAEAGAATSVAERLRASDDPRAWQMATRFESAGYDRR